VGVADGIASVSPFYIYNESKISIPTSSLPWVVLQNRWAVIVSLIPPFTSLGLSTQLFTTIKDHSYLHPSLREPLSAPPTPPISNACSSSPAKRMPFISLHPKATVRETPTLQIDEGNCDSIVNSPAGNKRSAQWASLESGNCDQDYPTKKFRSLKMTVCPF